MVALSVSTSFATWWRLPRLAAFEQRHPDLELRCITNDTDAGVGSTTPTCGSRSDPIRGPAWRVTS